MKVSMAAVVAGVALIGAGCGGSERTGDASNSSATTSAALPTMAAPTTTGTTVSPSVSTPAATTAMQLAQRVRAAVSAVTRLVQITEDNDPNNLLGRPNGYTDAVVLYDKRRRCDSVGVDCGATIEIWSSAADAKSRAMFIQKTLKNAPVLGTEYDYLNGNALLRISGTIKPSAAKAYAAAFGGEPLAR